MKKFIIPLFFLALVFALVSTSTSAKDKEYEAIVNHLQKNYQAKKVRIPFMWLARFAVKVVKPAGVRSFNVTLFENLNFSFASLDDEMRSAMRNSLDPEWSPILRIRSQNEDQVYAYMREDGKYIKMMLVTINKDQAAVIRATFNPDKLADFINNPRIFGVQLGDKEAKQIETDKDPTDSH
jgi:hypothetical protein